MQQTQTIQKEVIEKTQRLWVRLTRRCNNRCLFCLDKDAQNGTVVAKKTIVSELEQGRAYGTSRVVLSGGEPTIHPSFLEIVKTARALSYDHIQIITNGRMLAYRRFLKQAIDHGLKEVTFSFHGHEPRLHDHLTQTPGSFHQAYRGLLNAVSLRKDGLIISIDIVINKLNIMHLPEILKFFIARGVDEFDLLHLIPFGRAWDLKNTLFYDIRKAKAFLEETFALARDPNLHIWTNRFPPEHLENFESLIQDPRKLYDEIGGRRNMFERYLTEGKTPACRGERCEYCFLKMFCADLETFKNQGCLHAHHPPLCLRKRGGLSLKNISIKSPCGDIFEFLAFFIESRYFIKSRRCETCVFSKGCSGMSCDFIRAHGFKILVPVLAKQPDSQ